MRLRTIGASLGVLALLGASLLVPATLAAAAPPDGVDVTGTFGTPSPGDPRIGLQGTWSVPAGSGPVTSVQVRHSTDPTFATSTAWCSASIVTITATEGTWTCGPAQGGQLQHGLNYFQATADNGDGPLTSTVWPVGGHSFDRTPTITTPTNGQLTNAPTITFSGEAYPGTEVYVEVPGIQGSPAIPLCTVFADGSGAWSCTSNALAGEPDGTYLIDVSDTVENLFAAPHSITTDYTAPTAPVISSPPTPYSTTLTDHLIEGTGEAGATVVVTHSGNPDCMATVSGTGDWSCLLSLPAGTGTYSVSAAQLDAATNISPTSNLVSITVVAETLITGPADGSSLANSVPTITGTAEPGANITVQFWGPNTTACTTVASITGAFSCAPATALTPGGYQVLAENTDLALTSSPLSLTIVDATPTITAPATGSTTTDTRPTLSGTYTGADVTSVIVQRSSDGGVSYSVYCIDSAPAGTFSCASATTDITLGVNHFYAESYVGPNLVAAGAPITLTRTTPPAPPAPPVPPAPLAHPAPPAPPAPISWQFTLGTVGPIEPGASVPITADGLPGGSTVTVELHSTPRLLGTTTVGADGTLDYVAAIPLDIEPGDHSLVLTLTPVGGVPSAATQPIAILAPAPATPEEPAAPEEPIAEPAPTDEPQDASTTHSPYRGPLPEAPRSDPAAPSSLTESIPTAMEVVLSPLSVLTAGGMAVALLILVALPTEILNTTISANSRRFGRAFTWFDDATTGVGDWLSRVSRTTAVPAALLVALTAIVFSFSDPAIGFDVTSLRLFASLGIALFIVTWVASRISETILEKRYGIQSNLLLNPAALVFAVVGVVIARLLDFSPGFLIGLVIGLDLAAGIAERHRIRAIIVQYAVIFSVSVAAWLGYSLMVLLQTDGPTGALTAFLHDTLVAVTAEGLTAIAVAMLPLGFLDGKEVFDYSKKLWVGMFLVIGTAFALLVLPNELNGQPVSDLGIWALVLLGYAALTMLIWLLLKVTAKHDDDATIEHRRVGV